MKKILIIITLLIICSAFVNAESVKHLFVVDDTAPATDVIISADVINTLKAQGRLAEGGYETLLNSEVTKEDLADRTTLVIYNGQVKLVVGDTSPAEHVILAVQISSILKEKYDIDAGVALLSSEVESDDLTKIVSFPPVITYDIKSGLKEGETKTLTVASLDYEVTVKSLDESIVIFSVNGEITDKLSNLKAYTLSTGVRIQPIDISKEVTGDYIVIFVFNARDIEEKECMDSDGGRNYYLKGTARYSWQTEAQGMTDKCIYVPGYPEEYTEVESCEGPNCFLNEVECVDDNPTAHNYNCPGGCKDGACIKVCTDRCDGAFEIGSSEYNSCLSYCDSYPNAHCTDSDFNDNYYVKGFLDYTIDGTNYYQPSDWCSTNQGNGGYVDSCSGADCNLIEMICSDTTGGSDYVMYNCQSGCQDGACVILAEAVTTPPTLPADLKYYPDFFIKNGEFNAYLVVGDAAPAEDVIAAVDISSGIYSRKGISIDPAKLASEIKDPFNTNLIVIGNPCNNPISAKLMGDPSPCLKNFVDGQGLIKLYEYNGYAQLLVAGYSNMDTRKAARVLKNFDDYELSGKEMIVTGTFTTPVVSISTEPIPVEEIIEEEEVEEVIIAPVIEVQPDECTSNTDCDDNNPCSSDVCSGTPKKCSNQEVLLGCINNNNCLPIGTRVNGDFCDIDRTVKSQKTEDAACNNNYECGTNLCVDDKCLSPGLIQKILNWFKKLFG